MLKNHKFNFTAKRKLNARKSYLILLFVFTSLSISVFAQTQTVTGIVKDNAGEPLIGVSVQLKSDAKIGTITDLNGKFTITAPANSSLTFSYLVSARKLTVLKKARIY